MKKKNAQRPDFYMLPMNSGIVAIDVKHHELNENMDFILSSDKLLKYIELQLFLMELHNTKDDDLDYVKIKFFVIPSQLYGEAFAEVTLAEMASNEFTEKKTLPGGKEYSTIFYKFSIKERLMKMFTKNEKYEFNAS